MKNRPMKSGDKVVVKRTMRKDEPAGVRIAYGIVQRIVRDCYGARAAEVVWHCLGSVYTQTCLTSDLRRVR